MRHQQVLTFEAHFLALVALESHLGVGGVTNTGRLVQLDV
jgi:hypothetical protein